MVMPYGFKNAVATYQRLVRKISKDEIGESMEVYMDDMLVKVRKVPITLLILAIYLIFSDITR